VVSEADVLAEIVHRDRLDSTRADAPLVRAPGAVYVDSTGLPAETVLARLLALVRGEAGAT
jgi:cytidylate kinase